MIKPYLRDIINDHKKWKIQLTIPISFISYKDLKETCTMHTRSDNIMTGNETNNIIEELFESLLNYRERLEELMRESEFVIDNVDFLYYYFHRISLKRGGSYDLKTRNQI